MARMLFHRLRNLTKLLKFTGLILTKLDGTAKGGIAISITDEFNMPIKFIGVGEGLNDLKPLMLESLQEVF